MGYDPKYGKVTTEFGSIGPDEPVVVFRARDKFLPQVLAYYQSLCVLGGSPPYHLDLITGTGDVIRGWQKSNPEQVRTPASESSRDRTGLR